MNNELIQKQIESILFWKAEPVSFSNLAKILNISVEIVKEISQKLLEEKKNSGMIVIINDEKVSLATSPETSDLIEKLQKEMKHGS